jgi:translation initiation factor 1A
MPKKKGGKKKGGKGGPTVKRQLTIREDMEEYAKITKSLGDRRMNVVLTDSSEMLAVIPGRFRKRCWMSTGDVVLVSRRDYQDTKLDIIHKYTDDEKRLLLKLGEIPDFFTDATAKCEEEDDCGIIIEKEEEEEAFDFETL